MTLVKTPCFVCLFLGGPIWGGKLSVRLRTQRLCTNCSSGIVVHSLALHVPTKGIATLVKTGNYNGSALLGAVYQVRPPLGKRILLSNMSIRRRSDHHLTSSLTVLPRGPDTPNNLAIQRLIDCNQTPRRGRTFSKLAQRSTSVVS